MIFHCNIYTDFFSRFFVSIDLSSSFEADIFWWCDWFSCFPSTSHLESIEDDESVKQVKVAQQQTIIGTLDECFQVYTQEERVGYST